MRPGLVSNNMPDARQPDPVLALRRKKFSELTPDEKELLLHRALVAMGLIQPEDPTPAPAPAPEVEKTTVGRRRR